MMKIHVKSLTSMSDEGWEAEDRPNWQVLCKENDRTSSILHRIFLFDHPGNQRLDTDIYVPEKTHCIIMKAGTDYDRVFEITSDFEILPQRKYYTIKLEGFN